MNNILEATLQIKDKKTLSGIIQFKRRYLKRENLYFIQLHIRIKPEFCTVCGCVSQNNNIVKNGTKTSRITLFCFRPTGLLKSTQAEISL